MSDAVASVLRVLCLAAAGWALCASAWMYTNDHPEPRWGPVGAGLMHTFHPNAVPETQIPVRDAP